MRKCGPLALGISCALTGCFSKPGLATDAQGGDPGLLSNGDFELGCSSWDSFESELSVERSPSGRSGGACRVCATNREYYYIAQTTVRPFTPGEQYVATSWIRRVPGSPSHPLNLVMELRNGASVIVGYDETGDVAPGDEWKEITGTLDIGVTGAVDLVVRTGASFSQGESCFLIDDASLHVQ